MRKLLRDAAVVLMVQTEKGVYPYDMTDGEKLRLGDFSMSTNSMICHAIASIGGLLPDSKLANCREPDRDRMMTPRLRACLKNTLAHEIDVIVSAAARAGDEPVRSRGRSSGTRRSQQMGPFDSGTFGREDPFTLTWLVELLRLVTREPELAVNGDANRALKLVEKVARARVGKALQQPTKPVLEPIYDLERAVPHPLPLLRIVHLAKLFGGEVDDELIREVANIFLDRLHLQLSFRNIEHGGFDITELVFCFEGLLETAPLRATSSIVDSVHSAIDASRQLDPGFRAVTPFKTTGAGAVHLFSSVEVAASLLRCASLRSKIDDNEFFVRVKPALRDYLQWLQATVLTGRAKLPPASEDDSYPHDIPREYVGWQSEHSHTGDRTVHIWLTSQIILFLRSYECLLARDIAGQALVAVGLRSDAGEYREAQDAESRRCRAAEEDALQVAAKSPYRVVSRLNESFVAARLNVPAGDALYSCLLYGPPGTGKTTLARRVARDLGWPLLTITTSDFIIEGEAHVEARAKKLFEALNAQSDMVVFFDEIDRLVLDRDNPDYSQQGDMLQFMTPSMLTKINNLRRAESVIFIIGTNYADRIDQAIKRAGRIDERFLVLPPDLARRVQIIEQSLTRHENHINVARDEIREAALCGHWLTIAELQSAVREFARVGGSLVDEVRRVVPAVSLSSYLRRLERLNGVEHSTPPTELLEEAFLLVYLFMEGRDEAMPDEYDSLVDHWSTRPAGLVRDEQVERELGRIFDRAR